MTIGALSSPEATMALKASPSRCRSPRPTQQMRAGKPWNLIRTRHVEPVREMRGARHQLLDLGVGPENVLGIARQRRPPERTDAPAEERANVGRHEAGEVERVLDPFLERHL